MGLVDDAIKRKLNFANFFELNGFYISEIWNYYQAYILSLNLVGYEDKEFKKKANMIRKFLLSTMKNGDIDNNLYFKIKEQQKTDFKIISEAQESLMLNFELNETLGDIYKPGTIGISQYDE